MIASTATISDRDRHDQTERGRAGGEQREQDGLGRVGDGRQVVAREDGQGLDLGQTFGGLLVVGKRSSECDPSESGEGAVEATSRIARRRSGDR